MDAASSSSCLVTIAGPVARREVQASSFDRVSILPDRLEYALVPASSYSHLALGGGASSPQRTSDPRTTTSVDSGSEAYDDDHDVVYVTVDDSLVYARFFADFGPLDLGQTAHFCRDVEKQLAECTKVLLISSDHPHKRANAMTLLALYLVLVHKKTPLQAIASFRSLRPAQGFRDAACGLCSFLLTVFDCACGVYKAIQESIFNYETFPLDEYEHYDKLHHGDINWIVPGKILAFSGPQRERVVVDENGRTTLLAHEYAKVFHALGVSCVVRFNEPTTYDRRAFVQANIRHLDMHYPDGGNPTDEIMLKFVRTCERESGAVAVHCKAGLGRTGTNIAAYLMKRHRFSAVEAIAWCRICRPGSIVGPQQQFLVVKQPLLWKLATDDEEQKQQQSTQSKASENVNGVKRQSFAAMRERLPPASVVPIGLPTKRSFRRGSSIPSSGSGLVLTKPTNPTTQPLR